MDENKLQEALSNEAFVRSLFELSTAEEVQSALKEQGISLSLEDIEAVKNQLNAQSGEMSGEDLDSVSGGFTIPEGARLILPPNFPNFPLPRPRW